MSYDTLFNRGLIINDLPLLAYFGGFKSIGFVGFERLVARSRSVDIPTPLPISEGLFDVAIEISCSYGSKLMVFA